MWCGKRSFCREEQAPLIALVWCNSPSKECLSPSLSIQPSSFPKNLGNVIQEEEVSIRNPHVPHSRGRVIHVTKITLKTGSETMPPCSQSRQQCMSYTLGQLSWVLLTRSIDMDMKKDPNTSLELVSWYGHTIWQSEHVVPKGAHAENKDHLCLYPTVAETKQLWAGIQY